MYLLDLNALGDLVDIVLAYSRYTVIHLIMYIGSKHMQKFIIEKKKCNS